MRTDAEGVPPAQDASAEEAPASPATASAPSDPWVLRLGNYLTKKKSEEEQGEKQPWADPPEQEQWKPDAQQNSLTPITEKVENGNIMSYGATQDIPVYDTKEEFVQATAKDTYLYGNNEDRDL